jgi:hypothetical protein
VAVPHRRNAARFALPGQGISRSRYNLSGIRAHKQVCPFRNRHWAFSVLTQRQAGHTQSGSFFLDTPRVGQNQRRFAQQAQKIKVSHGRYQPQLCMMFDSALRKPMLGPRMHRKNHWHFRRHGIDCSQ